MKMTEKSNYSSMWMYKNYNVVNEYKNPFKNEYTFELGKLIWSKEVYTLVTFKEADNNDTEMILRFVEPEHYVDIETVSIKKFPVRFETFMKAEDKEAIMKADLNDYIKNHNFRIKQAA